MDLHATLTAKKQLIDFVSSIDYFEGQTTIEKLKQIPAMLAPLSNAGLSGFVSGIRQVILRDATAGYYRDTLPYLLQIGPFPLGSDVIKSCIGLDDQLDDALLQNILWSLLDDDRLNEGLIFLPVENFLLHRQLSRAVELMTFLLDSQLSKGYSNQLGKEFMYVLSRFPYQWPEELKYLINAHLPLITHWAEDLTHWYESFMAIPGLSHNGYVSLADRLFADFELNSDTIDTDVLDLIQYYYGNDSLAEKVQGYFGSMLEDSMTPKEVSDLLWFVDHYPAMTLPPAFITRLENSSKKIYSVAAGLSSYLLETSIKHHDKLNHILCILIQATNQRATGADFIVKTCRAAGVEAAQVAKLSCLRIEQLEADLGL